MIKESTASRSATSSARARAGKAKATSHQVPRPAEPRKHLHRPRARAALDGRGDPGRKGDEGGFRQVNAAPPARVGEGGIRLIFQSAAWEWTTRAAYSQNGAPAICLLNYEEYIAFYPLFRRYLGIASTMRLYFQRKAFHAGSFSRGLLRTHERASLLRANDRFSSPAANLAYPIRDGIPIMPVDEARKVD